MSISILYVTQQATKKDQSVSLYIAAYLTSRLSLYVVTETGEASFCGEDEFPTLPRQCKHTVQDMSGPLLYHAVYTVLTALGDRDITDYNIRMATWIGIT